MRRHIVLAVGTVLISSGSMADYGRHVSFWAGWQGAQMGDVQSSLEDVANGSKSDFLYLFGGTAHTNSSASNGGFSGGIEYTAITNETLGWGARLGYASAGEYDSSVTGSGASGETYFEEWNLNTSVIPLMAGLVIHGGDANEIQLRGALFLGVAFASATMKQAGDISVPWMSYRDSYSTSVPLSGHGFCGDASVRVSMNMSSHAVVFAEVGYVLAKVNEMTFDRNVDFDGDGVIDYKKGSHVEESNSTKPLGFDFSGGSVRVGISFILGQTRGNG